MATKPFAFQFVRYGIIAPLICFAAGTFLTGDLRVMAMRCFCGALSIILIGLVVHFAAIALDEMLAGHIATGIWMTGCTTLIAFMMFTGFRLAVGGFQ